MLYTAPLSMCDPVDGLAPRESGWGSRVSYSVLSGARQGPLSFGSSLLPNPLTNRLHLYVGANGCTVELREAVSFLQDRAESYDEPFTIKITKFDGATATISNE